MTEPIPAGFVRVTKLNDDGQPVGEPVLIEAGHMVILPSPFMVEKRADDPA